MTRKSSATLAGLALSDTKVPGKLPNGTIRLQNGSADKGTMGMSLIDPSPTGTQNGETSDEAPQPGTSQPITIAKRYSAQLDSILLLGCLSFHGSGMSFALEADCSSQIPSNLNVSSRPCYRMKMMTSGRESLKACKCMIYARPGMQCSLPLTGVIASFKT